MEVTQKQVMAMIKEFTGQANMLVAPRSFVKFTKDHISALVLNQIIYWSERTNDPEGWFYKSGDDWMEELTLTRFQVNRAVNHLKQFGVETKLKKANGAPTLHFRLNNELFYTSFFDFLGNGISTNLKMENRESDKSDFQETSNSLTNTTHDTTSNTTTTMPSPTPDKRSKLVPAVNRMVVAAVDSERVELRQQLKTLLPSNQQTTLSQATEARFKQAVDTYPLDWVRKAFDIASLANSTQKLNYLFGILEHWGRHGLECVCSNPKSPIPISRPANRQYSPVGEVQWGAPTAPGGPSPMNTYEGVIGDKLGVYGVDYTFVPVGI